MPIVNIFINKENKEQYLRAVLTWLKAEYDAEHKKEAEMAAQPKYNPEEDTPDDTPDDDVIDKEQVGGFWGNREIIRRVFDEYNAIIALDDQKKEIAGFMIWSRYASFRIEIDIVAVKKAYQRQGICRSMISVLANKFTDVIILSASALSQSEEKFERLGFTRAKKEKTASYGTHETTPYFKIIRPTSCPSLNSLPNGRVIAISQSPHIFYEPPPDPTKNPMQYFQIELDEKGKLRTPIIALCNPDGYIGIYYNQQLIYGGTAKSTVGLTKISETLSFLIMDRFDLVNQERYVKAGFLTQPLLEEEDCDDASPSEEEDDDATPPAKKTCPGLPHKKTEDEAPAASATTSSMQSAIPIPQPNVARLSLLFKEDKHKEKKPEDHRQVQAVHAPQPGNSSS